MDGFPNKMTFFFFLCLLVPGAHSSSLDSLIDVLISCDDTQSALGLACLFYVLLRYYELLLSHIFILDNVPEAIDQFSAFISNHMPVST